MDVGPFRSQRPVERRAVNRPDLSYRQPEEPQPVQEAPKRVEPRVAPYHAAKQEKSMKRFLLPLIGLVVAVVLGLVGWFALSAKGSGGATGIDNSKYQAVFFTNGQVYFGKLHHFSDEYMKLTEIYYLQTQAAGETDSENPQQTATDQSNVQLIKLGDEIHGPEDEMIISKDQVLFYENLKPDGKVAQSIEKHKNP